MSDCLQRFVYCKPPVSLFYLRADGCVGVHLRDNQRPIRGQ